MSKNIKDISANNAAAFLIKSYTIGDLRDIQDLKNSIYHSKSTLNFLKDILKNFDGSNKDKIKFVDNVMNEFETILNETIEYNKKLDEERELERIRIKNIENEIITKFNSKIPEYVMIKNNKLKTNYYINYPYIQFKIDKNELFDYKIVDILPEKDELIGNFIYKYNIDDCINDMLIKIKEIINKERLEKLDRILWK